MKNKCLERKVMEYNCDCIINNIYYDLVVSLIIYITIFFNY